MFSHANDDHLCNEPSSPLSLIFFDFLLVFILPILFKLTICSGKWVVLCTTIILKSELLPFMLVERWPEISLLPNTTNVSLKLSMFSWNISLYLWWHYICYLCSLVVLLISDSYPLNVSFIAFRILFSGSAFLMCSFLGAVIYSHSSNELLKQQTSIYILAIVNFIINSLPSYLQYPKLYFSGTKQISPSFPNIHMHLVFIHHMLCW